MTVPTPAMDTLSAKLRVFAAFKADKAVLTARLKDMEDQLAKAEADAIESMLDAVEGTGMSNVAGFRVQVDGMNYSITVKTHYSIRAEDRERGFEAP